MRRIGIITAVSMVALAFAASAALAAVAPGTYGGSVNTANAPGSSHVASGTIQCVVNSALDVNCSSYVLGGVGHTNANVALTANYTAIIDCYNHGVNPNNAVESHQTSFSPTSQAAVTSSKNGQLSVPTRSVSFSGAPIGCPNANWTPTIRPGSQTLLSFSYTLTFAGFTSPYITISQP